MNLFRIFRRHGTPVERVRRILANGEKLTSLEERCVDEAFGRFFPEASMIHPRLRDGVAAIGLWVCKELEWREALNKMNMFPSLSEEHLSRCAYSLAKAHYLLPLPIFLFGIGKIFNLKTGSTGEEFMKLFVKEHAVFIPTEIEKQIMELLECNLDESVDCARQQLGLEKIIRDTCHRTDDAPIKEVHVSKPNLAEPIIDHTPKSLSKAPLPQMFKATSPSLSLQMSVDDLLKKLGQGSYAERLTAIDHLEESPDPAAAAALRIGLTDSDAHIRERALRSMERRDRRSKAET